MSEKKNTRVLEVVGGLLGIHGLISVAVFLFAGHNVGLVSLIDRAMPTGWWGGLILVGVGAILIAVDDRLKRRSTVA